MKYLLGALILCYLSMPLGAQVVDDDPDIPEAGDRLRAQRVAYITQRLGLSSKQAEQFWPLHNEYETRMREINRKYRPARPVSEMSEAEVERLIEQRFRRDEELLALRRQYYEKFRRVITLKQIATFPKADREFKRDLLEQLRRRRRQ